MSEFLDSAITAHVQWKIKLLTAINGGEVPVKATACVDNSCPLGKWIYGDGQKYKNDPEFKELVENHKKFHVRVGKIIDLVVAKKITEAKAEINGGEFHKLSSATVSGITKLKSKVTQ
jgi:hypothetical protein